MPRRICPSGLHRPRVLRIQLSIATLPRMSSSANHPFVLSVRRHAPFGNHLLNVRLTGGCHSDARSSPHRRLSQPPESTDFSKFSTVKKMDDSKRAAFSYSARLSTIPPQPPRCFPLWHALPRHVVLGRIASCSPRLRAPSTFAPGRNLR